MLKKIFAILTLTTKIFALSITLNNGKENGNNYYVLHLENERPFKCQVKIDNIFYPPDTKDNSAGVNKNRQYHCFIEGVLKDNIAQQSLPFMDLSIKPDVGGFWVIVAPKIVSRLISIDEHLYQNTDTKQTNLDKSTHYSIIINEKTNIALSQTRPELDFPIIFPNLVLPNVGALDFNKNPLQTAKEGDISDYITIKNLFEQERYNEMLEIANSALKLYPNSVFLNEFRLYIIKALFKVNELQKKEKFFRANYNTRLINEAKAWIKNFANDRNYTQVLFMLMQAYLDDEDIKQAKHILDLLTNEYEDDVWSKYALLAYGDYLLDSDRIFDAIQSYEDVFYSAKDLDVASLSALRLAQANLKQEQKEQAKIYLQKVLEANKDYISRNLDISLNLANLFRVNELYKEANEIYKIIIDTLNKKDQMYEQALKNFALSKADEDNSEEIYQALNLYKTEFPNSEYISIINTAIDKLFFNIDNNQTNENLHAVYLDLMEKYKGSEIANKALLEEIKLHFKEEEYKKILALKNEIYASNEDKSIEILNQAASIVANKANQNLQCSQLILLIDEYNLAQNIKDKHKLFSCYMKKARFDEALQLSNIGIEDANLHSRIQWLSNAANALYALGKFQDALKASQDAIYQAGRIEYADPSRAIYYKFYSLLRLNQVQEAFACIEEMKNIRGAQFMLIELYDAAARYAALNRLDSAALNYAKKAIQLQAKLKISTFSPDIDFIYIDALKKLGDDDEALNAAQKLLKLNLNDESKARALYTISEIQIKQKLFSNAKEYIKQCLDIKKNTAWKALCIQQNELVNN